MQGIQQRPWKINSWQDIGIIAKTVKKNSAVYRYQEFVASLYERDYRFVVVHSETFACMPDAEAAMVKFQKEHQNAFFGIQDQIISTEQFVRRNQKGRPKKDESREYQTVYQLALKVGNLNQDVFQREKERLSCFVLITNIMDSSKSGATILDEYKSQSSVELQVKAIKDPEFVGALYLKRPDRIEALAYVVLMALLIKNLLERRVRRALKTEKDPLILPGNIKSFSPTADKILAMFSVIDVIHLAPGVREFYCNCSVA